MVHSLRRGGGSTGKYYDVDPEGDAGRRVISRWNPVEGLRGGVGGEGGASICHSARLAAHLSVGDPCDDE